MRTKSLAVAGGLLVAAFTGANMAYVYGTGDEITFTVTDKERIVEKSGDDVSSKYLVFTEDETFENTDSFLRFKFNSSDIQGKLKEGHTYEADVYGWRIPFFSQYRNIVDVREVTAPAP